MNESRKVLVEYRINRSKEVNFEVTLAMDNNLLLLALNRIYYSFFYMVSALALSRGFSTSKHKQLMGWFNREIIKPKKLPKDIGKYYQYIFELRQECDYSDLIQYEKDFVLQKFDLLQKYRKSVEDLIDIDHKSK